MNWKLIAKTYQRILAQRTVGWEQGEADDAKFDGGEWSGPAWGDTWQREEQEVAEYVAKRFNVEPGAVEFAVLEYEYVEQACFYNALDAKSGPTAMGAQV